MTVSHWRRSRSPERLGCDAVVIGAGICGLAGALHLQRKGLTVRVVERHTIGAGASTRNAGFLMRGAADHYAAAVREFGRDRAGALWSLTEANLHGLRAEGIESLSTYQAVPSCLLALDRMQAEELQEACEQMRHDGFDAFWQDSGSDWAWARGGIQGALVNPNDAAINGCDLLSFLSRKLRHAVHENTEVHSIDRIGPEFITRCADVEITSRHVLLCTNAYAGLLSPALASRITARRGQMLALRVPGVRLNATYYANHGSEYFRQAGPDAVVVGGCRTYHADVEVGYEDRVTPSVQTDIERFAERFFGEGHEVTSRWSGTMGFSSTGLPIIGPVADLGGAWFCGGFTGHGMSMAYECARIATAAMVDGANAIGGNGESPLSIGQIE